MLIRPATRLSIGLMFLTVSILFAGELLGLVPNAANANLDARKRFCESLAIQFSSATSKGDKAYMKTTLQAVVKRNADVLSAALRLQNGEMVLEAGDHRALWQGGDADKSTADNIVVPIFKGDNRWGAIEVHFAPPENTSLLGYLHNSFMGLVLFVAVLGFAGYMIFMRRALRELDPSGVIPERVKAAFDALAEGVLIMDEKENIVLANAPFASKVRKPLDQLIGRNASVLNWSLPKGFNQQATETLPWHSVFVDGKSQTGKRIVLDKGSKSEKTFMVNSAPILDNKSASRGVLVTFDDVTELEHKNKKLRGMLTELRQSQQQVESQNEELQFLATRDPLTSCLNRRAMNEQFDALFEQAQQQGGELICMMADIDHFKQVNDNYGHAAGDEIIKIVAEAITAKTRSFDCVGRYGGEEFCIVLPEIGLEFALLIAERIRQEIQSGKSAALTGGEPITASVGVSALKFGAGDKETLLAEADQALYAAKKSGRNRVLAWSPALASDTSPPALPIALDAPAANDADGNHEPTTERLQVRIKELETLAEQRSQALNQHAGRDGLTGLPNKDSFCERVDHTLLQNKRRSGVAAVMSIGISAFHKVNGTLGYAAGDQLLKEVAARLRETLRASDTVAVLGSDKEAAVLSRLHAGEFSLLLSDVADSESVTWIVKRLFDALTEPVRIGEHKTTLNSDIGVSVYPGDGESAEALLNHAGIARSHAERQAGVNNFQFHSAAINQAAVQQLKLERELQSAIENDEFELYYQPKVNLQLGAITGFEALLRWNHPERGVVGPDEFIRVAEQTRLINVIGDQVLRRACRQVAQWNRELGSELTLSVNLSPVQFQQKQLVDRVMTVLIETGLAPELLELEITETSIMEDMDAAEVTLKQLRECGIRIALDDFGTGYSAFNYLKQFPIDCLKIDREFVRDITSDQRNASIVATIIQLAHNMNLNVVAEGVETTEELALLRDMYCNEVQGYLFSPPVPVAYVAGLLEAQLDFSVDADADGKDFSQAS